MRANEMLWRIAEWLHDHLMGVYDSPMPFSRLSQQDQNHIYDKAAILYAKIINNQFVGEDNHND